MPRGSRRALRARAAGCGAEDEEGARVDEPRRASECWRAARGEELCRRRLTAAVDRGAETCGGDESAAVLLVPCGEARFERAKLDPATRWGG